MQTQATSASTATTGLQRRQTVQKVLIVNGNSDVLEVLEPVLDARNYDVVFVESSEHAYSQIKRVQPDLVVLCVAIDDAEGLNVLSMLKLDIETRNIPVVTYTGSGNEDDPDVEDNEPDTPLFSAPPALLMN